MLAGSSLELQRAAVTYELRNLKCHEFSPHILVNLRQSVPSMCDFAALP